MNKYCACPFVRLSMTSEKPMKPDTKEVVVVGWRRAGRRARGHEEGGVGVGGCLR